jgi:hypothetical protein
VNRPVRGGVLETDVYDPSIVFEEAGKDMRKHRILVPAALAAITLLGACGSDGGGDKATFSDQLQDTCRTIARGLRDIDSPTELADFEGAAKDASKVYNDGLDEMKKLKAPSKQSSDFKDLQSNLSDQVDLFDQIASAAGKDDAATVTTKVASLKKITADNADLADSLDAKACAFQPVFVVVPTTDTTPDTTPAKTTTTTEEPTTTEAPTTTAAPTTTEPQETFPPVTPPPNDTEPAIDNKTVEPLADKLTPQGDYSFVDTDSTTTDAVRTLLNLGPVFAAQPGTIGGVDVHANGINITRIFVFVPDADTITPGTIEEVQSTLAGSNPLTPASFAGIDGKTFPSGSTTFFVAQKSDTIVIAIAVGNDELSQGLNDFVDSLPS